MAYQRREQLKGRPKLANPADPIAYTNAVIKLSEHSIVLASRLKEPTVSQTLFTVEPLKKSKQTNKLRSKNNHKRDLDNTPLNTLEYAPETHPTKHLLLNLLNLHQRDQNKITQDVSNLFISMNQDDATDLFKTMEKESKYILYESLDSEAMHARSNNNVATPFLDAILTKVEPKIAQAFIEGWMDSKKYFKDTKEARSDALDAFDLKKTEQQSNLGPRLSDIYKEVKSNLNSFKDDYQNPKDITLVSTFESEFNKIVKDVIKNPKQSGEFSSKIKDLVKRTIDHAEKEQILPLKMFQKIWNIFSSTPYIAKTEKVGSDAIINKLKEKLLEMKQPISTEQNIPNTRDLSFK